MTFLFRPLALLLLAGSVLTACDSEPKQAQTKTAPAPAPKPVHYPTGPDSATAAAALPTQRLLSRSVAKHVFSTGGRPDQFELELLGDSVLTATVHFRIISAAGDTLWRERFPARALLDYGLSKYGSAPTAAQQRDYILERFRRFFRPTQFVQPAIGPGAAPDDHAVAAVWEEVRQTGLPGFAYSLYEEDGRRLAYVPSQRKAVVYYTCC